ncbi:MAG: ATP cone domain-containing protein, partial [Prevotella sp.]|nr:ATP cone domain-containing protein [Prevotella sp.]
MELKKFTITKRDGSRDEFSLDKIMNAIMKAFDAVEEPVNVSSISK